MSIRTKILLLGGVIAGPFFTVAWLVGAFGHQGYSSLRHPISSLSIGESGWIQSSAFLITGLLMLAFAAGVREALKDRGLSKWTWIFLATVGVGLLGAGLFVTDPMNGYPPGTPVVPTEFTVLGRLHRVFSALVFLGIPFACFSSARWFSSQDKSSWVTYSQASAWAFLGSFVVTTIAFLGVGGLDQIAGLLQRLTLTIGWTWVTLFAIHALSMAPNPANRNPSPDKVSA
jgi:hypothetical protein